MLTKTCIAHFVVILSIFIFLSTYTSQTKDFFAGKRSFHTNDFPDLITSQCDIAPPSNVELKAKTVSSGWGEYAIKDSSRQYVVAINELFKMCLGNITSKHCDASVGVLAVGQLNTVWKRNINQILALLPSDNSSALDTLYQQLHNAQKKVCPAIAQYHKDLNRQGAYFGDLQEHIHGCLTLVEYHRKNTPSSVSSEKASFHVQEIEKSQIERLEKAWEALERRIDEISHNTQQSTPKKLPKPKKLRFSLATVIVGGCVWTSFVIIVMLMVQKKMCLLSL